MGEPTEGSHKARWMECQTDPSLVQVRFSREKKKPSGSICRETPRPHPLSKNMGKEQIQWITCQRIFHKVLRRRLNSIYAMQELHSHMTSVHRQLNEHAFHFYEKYRQRAPTMNHVILRFCLKAIAQVSSASRVPTDRRWDHMLCDIHER